MNEIVVEPLTTARMDDYLRFFDDKACDGLKAQGLKTVQGRPVKRSNDPAANHLGPLSMYLKAGFTIVREDADGDVYVRKSLV